MDNRYRHCPFCQKSRRHFVHSGIKGLTAVLIGTLLPTLKLVHASTTELPLSCSMTAGFNLGGYEVSHTTGDRSLDRALIAELRNILKIIPVNPGFKIINDSRPNAFATTETIVPDTQGTALFGINLMREELISKSGGTAIAGIAAHECAHIYQFFTRYRGIFARYNTAKYMELHADLLAGFYMYHKVKNSGESVDIRAFARSLYEKGDWAFNDPSHHGTPEERVNAMQYGFQLADRKVNFESAAEQGANYVLRN